MKKTDFLIIGGGVVGAGIALSLRGRYPKASITLIEKEKEFGAHSSGRNSGVLHAGFYYTANSLKAKFTRAGNLRLRAYCESKGLMLQKCGKVVVAQTPEDLPQIDELLRRAKANQVELQEISEAELKKIEPRAKTLKRALWSPLTATIDPVEVLGSLMRDARDQKIDVVTNTKYLGRKEMLVQTSQGPIEAGYIINAAGLYADRIALDFGFSKNYRILPFKGLYLYANPDKLKPFNCHIYPVPNLNNPFLGVHYTNTVSGKVKLGPTAIPAFWREQYAGFTNFQLDEFFDVVWRQMGLFFHSGFDFKKLALEEIKKHSKKHMVSLAQNLASGVQADFFSEWGKPGIRAQLINIHTKKLEQDFVTEGDSSSFHVLNAVSPAFTSSLPFADYVCDKISELLGKSQTMPTPESRDFSNKNPTA